MTQDAGVESRRISEPGAASRAMPGLSLNVVPLGAGPYEATLTTVRLADAALHLYRSSAFMGFARTDADAAVLQFSCDDTDSLVLNGVPCGPRVVGASGEGTEVLLASRLDSSHAGIVLPSALAGALLEPPAGSKLWQPGEHTLLRASPASWERARRVVGAAGKAAAAVPQVFDTEQPRHALQEALLEALRDLVSGEGGAELRAPRSSKARRRIVTAADAYLRSRKDRPIYTQELCDALGVSASSLAEAFHAMFGTTPHRFLRLRRMSMVRAVLLGREGPAPLVKSVALSHGFWHLGQFAADYRVTFGESPSSTLVRAAQRAAPRGATEEA